jgi:hypothetical protein
MRSLTERAPLRWWPIVALCVGVACAPPSRASGALTCETANVAAAAANEIRKPVEAGPLFAALATRSPVRSCTARGESGKIVLDYAAADDSRLHVERDASIEYSLHELRFATAQPLDARELLTRVERDMFGDDGCGIDWSRGEASPPADASGMAETSYRGDVCNCQARVRADSSGRVLAVSIRSTC